jgi:drug/metabolite transporter (DMT)-like permease
VKADLLLLLTAAIWGFAFVAQRMGNAAMGPFTFNAIRFSLGAAALLPFLLLQRKREGEQSRKLHKRQILPILLTGIALFAGATCQQVGLLGTTAGKAGFITGLYVILVPLLALVWGRRTHAAHWIGAVFAVGGLYLLSVQKGFGISPYDLIVLGGAFVWAGHVHLVARYAGEVGAVRIAAFQFVICGLLSSVIAVMFETVTLSNFVDGIWPILYGGFLSVGLAYTLQVVAQRTADPSHAAVILSLEGAFAALGGWIILGEELSYRDLAGCALILGGMLVSQIFGMKRKPRVQDTVES